MGYCGFMFVPYLLLFVILFICFNVYLFIGCATQPTVKLYACNAVTIFNDRCCQNCLAQGINFTWRVCLARMHWEFLQGLDRVIAHNYQKSIVACNGNWIKS